MYRNHYLDSYKSSIQFSNSIEYLLSHFNHVYITLGSIITDI